MSESRSEVRLGSTEALEDAKHALANFAEEARSVITGMDLELRRAWHFLDREMPAYWEGRIKRLEFELAEARNSLFRKKLQAQGNDRPGAAIAEKEIVRKIERQLEEAQARLPLIRSWRMRMERELDEFQARSRGIRDFAEGGLDRPIDLLNRLASAIDAYTATALPRNAPERANRDSAGATDDGEGESTS